MSAVVMQPVPEEVKGDVYPTGEAEEPVAVPPPEPAPKSTRSYMEEELTAELTIDELKQAFRLFDEEGMGYITITTFRGILRELDDDWTEDDIDSIIVEIDTDSSGTIDFDEFVKIMT